MDVIQNIILLFDFEDIIGVCFWNFLDEGIYYVVEIGWSFFGRYCVGFKSIVGMLISICFLCIVVLLFDN